MKPYYQDNFVTIFHGDCLEVMRNINSIDSILTDPPYGEHIHNCVRRGGKEGLNQSGFIANYSRNIDLGFKPINMDIIKTCSDLFNQISKRWTLVFSDVESCHLWRMSFIESGLDYVRTGAWRKLNSTPQFTGDRPGVGFEAITICHKKGKKKWNGGGTDNVWTFPIVKDRGKNGIRLHPTQKPTGLIKELIRLFSDNDEIICDPFMGSGTTLRAAKDLNRKAIGIEIEEKYCEIAANRMSQEVLQFI